MQMYTCRLVTNTHICTSLPLWVEHWAYSRPQLVLVHQSVIVQQRQRVNYMRNSVVASSSRIQGGPRISNFLAHVCGEQFLSPGLNCACVNSSSHFNHSSYCVLFYLIVLYGCVCQPLINGYDDDDVYSHIHHGLRTMYVRLKSSSVSSHSLV